MPIQDTIRQRAHDAYFGSDAGMQASPFIDQVLALFKALLGGCPIPIVMAQVNGNRIQQARARRRIGWEAASMTDDPEEVAKLTDCCMTVAQGSTVEEAKEYAAT